MAGRSWWPRRSRSQPRARVAYAQPFRDRPAYSKTFEDSVYVAPTSQRQGVGVALLSDVLTTRCIETSVREVLAVIEETAARTRARLAFIAKLGFEDAGYLRNVGYLKFSRWRRCRDCARSLLLLNKMNELDQPHALLLHWRTRLPSSACCAQPCSHQACKRTSFHHHYRMLEEIDTGESPLTYPCDVWWSLALVRVPPSLSFNKAAMPLM